MKSQRASFAAALLLAGSLAWGLDAGLTLRSGNLHFPWGWDEPLDAARTAFPWDELYWCGEAWIEEELGGEARLRVAYERDPVLRNSVLATVEFERGIARIEVGPRIGLFNDDEAPFSAGLASSIRLQWPGVAYCSLRSEGGLAIGFVGSSDDPQAKAVLAAGFYVPNAIVSAVVEAKRFNELDSGGEAAATDSWTRYALEFDIYKKGAPYTLLCSLGYEQRSKEYVAAGATDSLGAVMIGATASFRASPAVSLSAGLSSGFYVFGLKELEGRGPESSSFMFDASLGLSFDVDALRERAERVRAARAEAAASEAARAAAEAGGASASAQPAEALPGEAAPGSGTPPEAASAGD